MATTEISLKLILLCALFIQGLHLVTSENNIFYKVQPFVEDLVGEWYAKPIITCQCCMSSLWGTLYYVIFTEHLNLIVWVATVMAIAGINRVLKGIAP